ncbi:MAG: class I SAM-dependent methyltransferase [bacterium]
MQGVFKTILNSEKTISSKAEDFYKEYWTDGECVRDITTLKNLHILKKYFPKLPQNKKILEIGVGGEGGIIKSLKDNNYVYGIDVSDSAIKNSEKFNLDVIKLNLDNEKIPFEDSSVDIVFAFEVFEHFSNPQHAIEEIKRVLVDDGVLLISIPNQYTYHWPRLFYPDLFIKDNFFEFLIINGFDT